VAEDEDDLTFLLRLQSEEAAAAAGGWRGAEVRAIVQRLQHPNDTDDDDEEEEDEDEEDEEEGGKQEGRQQEQEEAHADYLDRPHSIWRALELWDLGTTQALLAADPDLIFQRDAGGDHDLCMPLAVAIAARFDRGCKLLLSQLDPPCPLYLVDGRGYR
jgi:hypothetical protein